MLIDPLTAFAAIKSATSIVSQGIKTGKKIADMGAEISKWANAESSLDIHASNKGKGGILAKLGLSSIEEDAIAAYLRKKELADKRKQLRELFLLYADNGLKEWETLQGIIAAKRRQKKEEIRLAIIERKKIQKIVGIVTVIIILFIGAIVYARLFGMI